MLSSSMRKTHQRLLADHIKTGDKNKDAQIGIQQTNEIAQPGQPRRQLEMKESSRPHSPRSLWHNGRKQEPEEELSSSGSCGYGLTTFMGFPSKKAFTFRTEQSIIL